MIGVVSDKYDRNVAAFFFQAGLRAVASLFDSPEIAMDGEDGWGDDKGVQVPDAVVEMPA